MKHFWVVEEEVGEMWRYWTAFASKKNAKLEATRLKKQYPRKYRVVKYVPEAKQ